MAEYIGTVSECYKLGKDICEFVAAVKHASKERQALLDEVNYIQSTLKRLRDIVGDKENPKPLSPALQDLLKPTVSLGTESSSTEAGGQRSKFHLFRHGAEIGSLSSPEPKYPMAISATTRDIVSHNESGVLSQLTEVLSSLEKRLKAKDGAKEVFAKGTWFWKQDGIAQDIKDMARLRMNIDHALNFDTYNLSKDNYNLSKDIRETQLQEVTKTTRHEIETTRLKIMTWLSTLEFYKRQTEIFEDSYPSAGWLLESNEFKAWSRGRPWILWCYGDPGAGKTVLCSQIIHHLEQSYDKNDALVLYMYLDYKDKERQSLANLTGSLIKQIVQHQQFSFPPGELNNLFLASREGEARAEQSDMLRILREQFKAYSKIFIVADGWNDVDDVVRDGLDDLFLDLLMTEDETPASNVSVMVTARSSEDESARYTVTCTVCQAKELRVYCYCFSCEQDEKHFDLCESCVAKGERCSNPRHSLQEPQRVYMLVQPGDDEIRQLVEFELNKRTKQDRYQKSQGRLGSTSLGGTSLARRLGDRPDLRQQVCDKIVGNSRGSYLLASLYIKDVASRTNVKQIEDALLNLPEGLDGMYQDKMKRIEMQSRHARKVGMDTLYWIVYTSRPLSFAEIQVALAVRVGQPSLDEREKTDEADLILYTAGLVTVAADKTAVRIHLSLHEYLKKQGQQWFSEAERVIAETLLTYLNYEAMTRPFSGEPSDSIQIRLETFPLLSYAALYWNDHVASVCSQPGVQALLLDFLGNSSRIELCVQVSYALQSKLKIDLDVSSGANGLHLAALYGLDSVIPELLQKKGLDIDAIDPEYGQTALMYACKNGHVSTVRVLLDLGASINVRSARETSAFLEAFTGNTDDHAEIVDLLLEQPDLDVNIRYSDEGDRSVLMMSTFAGFFREEVVKLLLQKPGIDVNQKDFNGDTALSLAATNGNEDVVRLLLTHSKIDIDSVNNSNVSALTIAAKSNSDNITDQLLESQAETSLKDGEEGCTAFFSAIEAGNKKAMKSFSKHRKNNLYTVDNKQRATLHAACSSGDLDVVRLLLCSDLPKSSRASGGQTPLHEACRGGHIDVIQTLLQIGVDPTITDNQKRTPLRVAWENGNEDTIRWMQDPQNISGDTLSECLPPLTSLPTWSLAKSNHFDILQQRIMRRDDSGYSATTNQVVRFDLADQNPDTGDTALHYAIINEHSEMLRCLLEANLPVDLLNHLERTPLHLAARSRDPDLTEMLLQHSPNLEIPDIVGLTPLVTAQKQENYDMAVLLIAAGASINDCHRAHIQRTFFAAVELGYADVAGKLIAKGADHLRQNPRGLMAKQIALAHDDVEMVRVFDMQKSFFRPLRSSTQRSRDFESATTPPLQIGPFVFDSRPSPFRPRPSMPGSFPEDYS